MAQALLTKATEHELKHPLPFQGRSLPSRSVKTLPPYIGTSNRPSYRARLALQNEDVLHSRAVGKKSKRCLEHNTRTVCVAGAGAGAVFLSHFWVFSRSNENTQKLI